MFQSNFHKALHRHFVKAKHTDLKAEKSNRLRDFHREKYCQRKGKEN